MKVFLERTSNDEIQGRKLKEIGLCLFFLPWVQAAERFGRKSRSPAALTLSPIAAMKPTMCHLPIPVSLLLTRTQKVPRSTEGTFLMIRYNYIISLLSILQQLLITSEPESKRQTSLSGPGP